MNEWMEPAIKSLLLIAALYCAASYIFALDRLMASDGKSGKNLTGMGLRTCTHPLRTGLGHFFGELAAPVEQQRIRARVGSVILVTIALLTFAAIPFGAPIPGMSPNSSIAASVAPGIRVGLLFVLAMSGLCVCGSVIASSEVRETAHVANRIAEFVPLGLSTVGVVLLSGSMNLERIVASQSEWGIWWIMLQPLGFAAFLPALLESAVRLRSPLHDFDDSPAARADSIHTIPTGIVSLTDILHMIVLVYLLVILFFGGWNSGIPAASSGASDTTWTGALIGFVALQLKVASVIVALVWFYRKHLETGPSRFLRLAHKMAIPFGLLNILVTGFAFPFFDRSALVAKAAVAWGVLLIAGMVFNLLSRRQGTHS